MSLYWGGGGAVALGPLLRSVDITDVQEPCVENRSKNSIGKWLCHTVLLARCLFTQRLEH
jgi:hypothetical protein